LETDSKPRTGHSAIGWIEEEENMEKDYCFLVVAGENGMYLRSTEREGGTPYMRV
jgi:hypothetical protein